MKDVWDQADNQVMLADFSIEGIVVCDIEGDRCGKFVVAGKILRSLESSAG